MAKINFTAGRVNDFKCPPDKQQAFIWDSVTEGLGLRSTAGSKNYIFQGKLAGQAIRIKIGGLDRYTIDDARKEARRLKTQIDEGRDPRTVKAENIAVEVAKREQAKHKQALALDAWNEYIKARTPKWSQRHKADHESMARLGGEKVTRGRRNNPEGITEAGILRHLLTLPLSAITRDAVAAWLEPEAIKRPTRTRLAISLLSTFLTWCSDRPQYRDQINLDACKRMKQDLPKAQTKDDCLQREQLQSWFENVRKIENPTQCAYLQCLLLTGARRNELSGIRWDDVDFRWLSIVIRDKVEGERTIPLTPYVASLMLELRRLNNTPPNVLKLRRLEAQGEEWKPSPWVFSSTNAKDGRIQEPRIAHNKALTAAGLPNLSIHGLRRSFGTLCEWVEMPAGISAQIMGHKPSAIAEKHYRRRPLDLLRVWHTKIEGWILEQAGIEQPSIEAGKLKLAARKA
ncbi:tyrosine-type recombinase/integrase [Zwartia sp.]|uniref:tyrosine-type recombinase/integrase n=1 Tax=Zwartia sp. TaxID=2978004 RepID=UPI003BB18258